MMTQPSTDQLSPDFEAAGRVPAADDILLQRLRRLREHYLAGHFGGTVHEVYPDVPRSSRENYLYFTLAPALNYQRSSEALWRSALATYSDPETRFVFFPENTSQGELAYRTALVKHGLALQPQRHTYIWFRISSALREDFESDPRILLSTASHDVVQIKRYIAANKKRYPYLSGPKLVNYWLYMLLSFTDVVLEERGSISIIPDVHVCRATVHLGLLSDVEAKQPELVAKTWQKLLAGSGLAPCDLHAPLWRWSRASFVPSL